MNSAIEALEEKLSRARTILAGFERAVVAFSGGVDSTLVAKLAQDVLGPQNTLAATADSPSLAREDLREATQLAAAIGVSHVVIQTG